MTAVVPKLEPAHPADPSPPNVAHSVNTTTDSAVNPSRITTSAPTPLPSATPVPDQTTTALHTAPAPDHTSSPSVASAPLASSAPIPEQLTHAGPSLVSDHHHHPVSAVVAATPAAAAAAVAAAAAATAASAPVVPQQQSSAPNAAPALSSSSPLLSSPPLASVSPSSPSAVLTTDATNDTTTNITANNVTATHQTDLIQTTDATAAVVGNMTMPPQVISHAAQIVPKAESTVETSTMQKPEPTPAVMKTEAVPVIKAEPQHEQKLEKLPETVETTETDRNTETNTTTPTTPTTTTATPEQEGATGTIEVSTANIDPGSVAPAPPESDQTKITNGNQPQPAPDATANHNPAPASNDIDGSTLTVARSTLTTAATTVPSTIPSETTIPTIDSVNPAHQQTSPAITAAVPSSSDENQKSQSPNEVQPDQKTDDGYAPDPSRPVPRHLPKVAKNRPENARVFIGNLASEYTSIQEIVEVFHKYGDLIEEPVLRRSFGFVQYSRAEAAKAAVVGEQGRIIGGIPLDLSIADNREVRKGTHIANNTPFQHPKPTMQGQGGLRGRPRVREDNQAAMLGRKRRRSVSPASQARKGGVHPPQYRRHRPEPRLGIYLRILCMSPTAKAYARHCENTFRSMAGLKADVVNIVAAGLGEALGRAMRDTIPYVMVVASKDVEDGTCTIRTLEKTGYEKSGRGNGVIPLREAVEVCLIERGVLMPTNNSPQQGAGQPGFNAQPGQGMPVGRMGNGMGGPGPRGPGNTAQWLQGSTGMDGGMEVARPGWMSGGARGHHTGNRPAVGRPQMPANMNSGATPGYVYPNSMDPTRAYAQQNAMGGNGAGTNVGPVGAVGSGTAVAPGAGAIGGPQGGQFGRRDDFSRGNMQQGYAQPQAPPQGMGQNGVQTGEYGRENNYGANNGMTGNYVDQGRYGRGGAQRGRDGEFDNVQGARSTGGGLRGTGYDWNNADQGMGGRGYGNVGGAGVRDGGDTRFPSGMDGTGAPQTGYRDVGYGTAGSHAGVGDRPGGNDAYGSGMTSGMGAQGGVDVGVQGYDQRGYGVYDQQQQQNQYGGVQMSGGYRPDGTGMDSAQGAGADMRRYPDAYEQDGNAQTDMYGQQQQQQQQQPQQQAQQQPQQPQHQMGQQGQHGQTGQQMHTMSQWSGGTVDEQSMGGYGSRGGTGGGFDGRQGFDDRDGRRGGRGNRPGSQDISGRGGTSGALPAGGAATGNGGNGGSGNGAATVDIDKLSNLITAFTQKQQAQQGGVGVGVVPGGVGRVSTGMAGAGSGGMVGGNAGAVAPSSRGGVGGNGMSGVPGSRGMSNILANPAVQHALQNIGGGARLGGAGPPGSVVGQGSGAEYAVPDAAAPTAYGMGGHGAARTGSRGGYAGGRDAMQPDAHAQQQAHGMGHGPHGYYR